MRGWKLNEIENRVGETCLASLGILGSDGGKWQNAVKCMACVGTSDTIMPKNCNEAESKFECDPPETALFPWFERECHHVLQLLHRWTSLNSHPLQELTTVAQCCIYPAHNKDVSRQKYVKFFVLSCSCKFALAEGCLCIFLVVHEHEVHLSGILGRFEVETFNPALVINPSESWQLSDC